MTVYVQPGQEGSKVQFKDRYGNWIGGVWVAPTTGQYIENVSPLNGKQFTEVARGAAARLLPGVSTNPGSQCLPS